MFLDDKEQKEECFEGRCAEGLRYFQRTLEMFLHEGLEPEIGECLGVMMSSVYFSPSWF